MKKRTALDIIMLGMLVICAFLSYCAFKYDIHELLVCGFLCLCTGLMGEILEVVFLKEDK